MGSLTSGTGRRGSSRRGSRSSDQQQQAGQNHNRDSPSSGGQNQSSSNPYISVAVRVLQSRDGPMSWNSVSCSCRDAWQWIWSAVEQRCPPGWTPWIVSAGLATLSCLLFVLWILIDIVWIYSQLCSLAVPFFALMSGYLLLAIGFRHSWTPTAIYLTFCGSVIGETVGYFLLSTFVLQVRATESPNRLIRLFLSSSVLSKLF